MLKLMTLNVWGYYDWQKRQKNIASLLSKNKPDIVALQEVQFDSSMANQPQSELISAGYAYTVYFPLCVKKGVTDSSTEVMHGLALLSKYPILRTSSHILKQHIADHDAAGLLFADVQVGGQTVSICNVHFDNTDTTSLLHLKEALKLCHAKSISPILLGDFNIYNLPKYQELINGYSVNLDHTPYISFPREKETLDYIVIPNDTYSFESVNCSDEYVSDHNAVWVSLSQKS
jgi:endonuclease/exonuclease/phosphatase family metal-dependent hydrolase